MHLLAAGTGNVINLLGGPAITIVMLAMAVAIGYFFLKGHHNKGVSIVLGVFLVAMVASLAVNVNGRETLGAWMNAQIVGVG
jgi:hypothetical protein